VSETLRAAHRLFFALRVLTEGDRSGILSPASR
jgi:hypothetical protein